MAEIGHRTVPPPAVALAREIVVLFERDHEVTLALADAKRRLLAATDELTAGLALARVAQTIRSAFADYRCRARERRMVMFEIGEANGLLIAALTAAGFSEEEARQADVYELAADDGPVASGGELRG